jgi:hypothetical protein
MRATEFLIEGATDILYHYTGINSALKILTNGEFELSSVTGNPSEEQYAPPGYPYFLSTTRSRQGDYHRWVGTGAVMFVLDGQWFQQRYPVKPVDYWERSWLHSGGSRSRESEDRVFSRDPTIATGGVKMIHVLLKEQHENRSPEVRKLLILAKQLNIPAYLYDDEQSWRLQDTRKAITVGQAASLLKGQDPSPRSYGRKYLSKWLELIHKKASDELSKEADRLAYNMKYYALDDFHNLNVDMSNARKPGSSDHDQAVKIISYMRANRMTTLRQLLTHLGDKWKTIHEKEHAAKKMQVAKLQQQVDRLGDKWQANGAKEQAAKKVSQ